MNIHKNARLTPLRREEMARGVIATVHTYHGNTTAVAQLSRTNIPSTGVGSHVRHVPAPDSFRPLGGEAGTAHAYYQLNLKFHKTLAETAGNAFLLDLIKTNARKLMAYYRARYHYRGTIKISADEHRQIAELILARRPAEAKELLAAVD